MPTSPKPTTILVVDDESDMEQLFELRFRRNLMAGEYQFIYTLSAYEALEVLEQQPDINIVLCDINMPGMDGLTLLSKLLEQDEMRRVIMVSAYGNMQNIRRAMNLGAFDFVVKPIDFEDLKTTIAKTMKEVEIGKRARISKELEEKNRNLRVLDQMKSQFFTNITHEFRTPLTSILGTADQIAQDPDTWVGKGIPVIKRNGHQLLNLITQVLDLRKLESGKLEVRMIQGDVIAFIHYLLESFHPILENKNIRLDIKSDLPEIVMDFDADKLTSILSNLLSNAFKYTARDGSIEININKVGEQLQIAVSDSGAGIPEEALSKVFERFYRGQTLPPATQNNEDQTVGGAGIGLALTKELVELLEGKIEVESKIGEGSTFTVLLPIRQEALRAALRAPDIAPTTAGNPTPVSGHLPADAGTLPERPHLLIVEDNLDVASYLSACLEGDYLIHIAWDGQEGIDYAIEQVPDIIISDVMMPKKDGYELCRTLKNDRRTSHIPIVLLTAKADQESRIEGLEKGADAYLAKPFNQRELFVRLDRLLELRKKLQEHYSHLENLPGENHDPDNLESAFLWSVRQAIEKNMDNEQFGITELCREVGASRSQMHNKIKALTNQSTSIFVRSIRLNKAKELLLTTDLNVTQVAFEVGFKDPKYFSTKFLELFGERPSKSRK